MTKTTLSHKKWGNVPALIENALKKSSITELNETQLNLLRLCQLIVDIKARRAEEVAKENKNA